MPSSQELDTLERYLNQGMLLERIALAAEKIAGVQGETAEVAEKRRRLASQVLFGNNRSMFSALEQIGNLEQLAQEEARIAAIDSSMHLVGSETLSGKPYHERKFEIPKGVVISDPVSVKKYLDGVVLGQDAATKSLAIGLVDMYHRVANASQKSAEPLNVEKNNLLFIGPSGVGKTYLAFTAADLIALPFVKVAATSLTARDGEGVNFSDVLREYCKVTVYSNKSGKQERRLALRDGAQYGVLFIDEIDKLRKRETLQHDLLPILERGEYRLGDGVSFDTANLWIVAAGAFNGIEDIIRARLSLSKDAPREEVLANITEKDFVGYGFVPELARRFQGYVPFMPLSEDALYKILTQPQGSLLSQYQSRFKSRGFQFEVEDGALRAISRYSTQHSEGANGLRTGFLRTTEDLLFQPQKYQHANKVVLTEQHAKNVLKV